MQQRIQHHAAAALFQQIQTDPDRMRPVLILRQNVFAQHRTADAKLLRQTQLLHFEVGHFLQHIQFPPDAQRFPGPLPQGLQLHGTAFQRPGVHRRIGFDRRLHHGQEQIQPQHKIQEQPSHQQHGTGGQQFPADPPAAVCPVFQDAGFPAGVRDLLRHAQHRIPQRQPGADGRQRPSCPFQLPPVDQQGIDAIGQKQRCTLGAAGAVMPEQQIIAQQQHSDLHSGQQQHRPAIRPARQTAEQPFLVQQPEAKPLP